MEYTESTKYLFYFVEEKTNKDILKIYYTERGKNRDPENDDIIACVDYQYEWKLSDILETIDIMFDFDACVLGVKTGENFKKQFLHFWKNNKRFNNKLKTLKPYKSKYINMHFRTILHYKIDKITVDRDSIPEIKDMDDYEAFHYLYENKFKLKIHGKELYEYENIPDLPDDDIRHYHKSISMYGGGENNYSSISKYHGCHTYVPKFERPPNSKIHKIPKKQPRLKL